MIPSELNAYLGLNRDKLFQTYRASAKSPNTDKLQNVPESLDWRDKGVVQPAKDQGSCGSCWAFSAIATLESHIAIQTGSLLDLSEQQLVSCAPNPDQCGGTGGCAGSTQWIGFQYHKTAGAVDQDTYSYEARTSACNQTKAAQKAVTITDLVRLPENDYNALMNAVVTQGPIAISVAASSWFMYDSGVFNDECDLTINHAVTLVGYGVDADAGEYWLIKNSWSEGWGESGYIRLGREKNCC